jgi:hypothetical protein
MAKMSIYTFIRTAKEKEVSLKVRMKQGYIGTVQLFPLPLGGMHQDKS